jgi:hypothetical protein
MTNFNRTYRLTAGRLGSVGFELGGAEPVPRISFSIERSVSTWCNVGKVKIYNLTLVPAQFSNHTLAVLVLSGQKT